MESIPQDIADKICSFPEYRYGANRIKVWLDDGTCFDNVIVAWGEEIISVEGSKEIPFDPSKIIRVENCP